MAVVYKVDESTQRCGTDYCGLTDVVNANFAVVTTSWRVVVYVKFLASNCWIWNSWALSTPCDNLVGPERNGARGADPSGHPPWFGAGSGRRTRPRRFPRRLRPFPLLHDAEHCNCNRSRCRQQHIWILVISRHFPLHFPTIRNVSFVFPFETKLGRSKIIVSQRVFMATWNRFWGFEPFDAKGVFGSKVKVEFKNES